MTTLAERTVDNPLVTDAVGEARPDFLKITVTENVTTRIGGLAHIRPYDGKTGKRMPHHERTAERFLNLYQARYGRNLSAIDLSKVRVDTSIVGHDGEMVSTVYATREIEVIEHGTRATPSSSASPPVLNQPDFQFLVAVIFLGLAISDYTGKATGRALDAEVARFLAILDRLSEHWGNSMRRAA